MVPFGLMLLEVYAPGDRSIRGSHMRAPKDNRDNSVPRRIAKNNGDNSVVRRIVGEREVSTMKPSKNNRNGSFSSIGPGTGETVSLSSTLQERANFTIKVNYFAEETVAPGENPPPPPLPCSLQQA